MKKIILASVLSLACAAANAATIKIATIAPDGTAWMKEMRAAAEAVKTKTSDRVEIKFYPGGVMGDNATVLRKIKIGQLQGAAFTGGEAASITPDANVYSQPFQFRSEDEVDKVRAKVDPLLKAGFEKAGFVVPGIAGGGFAYLFSVNDIHDKETLKAAKVWVPQGDHVSEIALKAAGVTPIPLPIADVYTSLQTGLIDAAASTTAGAIALQWHTKVKHMFDLPLMYVVGFLAIDKKNFDAIGADDRKIVDDEIGAAFARIEKGTRADNQQARAALQSQGVAITPQNADERKTWDAIGADARKNLTGAGGISPELAATVNKALDEARK
ncbi:MAG: TRAP transporter substrate-binding protein DctP [Rudaea sp.]|uniref:TRAP transporter substrate-binding protein n=1 Tax=Rudaea sp. TaxID=2136325 RepID=UPI0039E4A8D4